MKDIALRVACGNQAAAEFLVMLADVLHFWDDLIDRDVALPDGHIHMNMWNALMVLPSNSFYRQHFESLRAVLAVAISNWHAATAMEREGGADAVSFVIRSSYVDLAVAVAHICGGPAHADQVAREVRCLAHAEGFDGYRVNLQQERSARDVL